MGIGDSIPIFSYCNNNCSGRFWFLDPIINNKIELPASLVCITYCSQKPGSERERESVPVNYSDL